MKQFYYDQYFHVRDLATQINAENYQAVLSQIYFYVKSIANHYTKKSSKVRDAYQNIKTAIRIAEYNAPDDMLINIPRIFDKKISPENTIELLVHTAYNKLLEKFFNKFYIRMDTINLNDINFVNLCKKSSEIVKELCDELHITCYTLPIFPGFSEQDYLYGGARFHYANIIKIDNQYYLVDLTYSQFFYTKQNNLDRIGLLDMFGCNPGYFMLKSKIGTEMAKELMQRGYTTLDEDKLKAYLDGFAISFRNGLYYENTGDFSYTTPFSYKNYIDFLEGTDNQINYDGRENLGYQRRPLKDPLMRFKR